MNLQKFYRACGDLCAAGSGCDVHCQQRRLQDRLQRPLRQLPSSGCSTPKKTSDEKSEEDAR